jgi:hypothetical protein
MTITRPVRFHETASCSQRATIKRMSATVTPDSDVS